MATKNMWIIPGRNQFERIARAEKVVALAQALVAAEIPVADVARMDDAQWAMAAQAAGTRAASTITRELVIRLVTALAPAPAPAPRIRAIGDDRDATNRAILGIGDYFAARSEGN